MTCAKCGIDLNERTRTLTPRTHPGLETKYTRPLDGPVLETVGICPRCQVRVCRATDKNGLLELKDNG